MGRVDCIIVGQGLAGTCLAFQFLRKGKSILVMDEDRGSSCTAIAAGTFNPLVFKTFSPTWMAPVLFPYLYGFYRELGHFLSTDILTSRAVIKGMKSMDQRELWVRKSLEEPSSQFMDGELTHHIQGLKDELAYGKVRKGGNIHILKLLTLFRKELIAGEMLVEERLDVDQVQLHGSGVSYQDVEADHMIFCQGHELSSNPLFSNLPLKGTKGEVLIIKSPELNSMDIIHNRINIVPMGDDLYWVGATFDWGEPDLKVTQKGKEELEKRLRETLNVPFSIVDQKAGIRPTVRDRRPLIGFTDSSKRIGVFNGLGTRGVMLAPYFSGHLIRHIYDGDNLDPAVDINRFSESR